jgi:hypothetical protein
MTLHYFSRTIFLGCMLVVFAGVARADIVQCVDGTGTVSYMDVPCQKGANVARASALTKPSALRANVSSPARPTAAARAAREVAWKKRPASNHRLARDVATLEAARSSLLQMDNESSLLRRQKLVALEQDRRWFKF